MTARPAVADPAAAWSVIIPTRRLDTALRARCAALRALLPGAEVLIVEPLPEPGAAAAQAADDPAPEADGLRRLRAPRGRGTQCLAGARAARGSLLLFLHDDTTLPADAPALIARAFARPATQAACFRLRFDQQHWLLGLYGWCSRFDSVWTTFGDQGLVIRRAFYDAIGGHPDWPLFEDVEIARRARRRTRIVKLPGAVTTSAVRFIERGVMRQQALNAWLMLRFLTGASPATLRARYEAPASRRGRD